MVAVTTIVVSLAALLSFGVTLSYLIQPLAIAAGAGLTLFLLTADVFGTVRLLPKNWQNEVLQAALAVGAGVLLYRSFNALLLGGLSTVSFGLIALSLVFGPRLVFGTLVNFITE